MKRTLHTNITGTKHEMARLKEVAASLGMTVTSMVHHLVASHIGLGDVESVTVKFTSGESRVLRRRGGRRE